MEQNGSFHGYWYSQKLMFQISFKFGMWKRMLVTLSWLLRHLDSGNIVNEII